MSDEERAAKIARAAEARAARTAAAGAAGGTGGPEQSADEERAAKIARAAEARAARAASGAAGHAAAGTETPPAEKPPSPNQPKLEGLVALIREAVSAEAVEDAFINDKDNDLITLVIHKDHWLDTARLLKEREGFNYLRNLSGVDYETHMEVVYHLLSLETKELVAVKVRTDRDQASVPSVTPLWATADWNEREAYDLLGIDFPGHPDLRRIMMPDNWVGHPLRKDYEPIDPEV
ncbi:NADH-quinone oxidoreductase subunit C [Paenibacillus thermoaerophilus]|nr:NADH-quinone oxidoreductase subunit C [Paenibacillus thermoaerophilus]